MHTTEDDETIERDLTLAPRMRSVGLTASLRSQEDARPSAEMMMAPARTTRASGLMAQVDE